MIKVEARVAILREKILQRFEPPWFIAVVGILGGQTNKV